MLEYGPSFDSVFQALADPTRRAIFKQLCQGSASVSALGRPFDITLAAVVQHVQILEESGLITTQKIGRSRTCFMRPEALDAIDAWVHGCRGADIKQDRKRK